MSLGISEGKPGTVTEVIALPLVGASAPVELEPDLAGVESLGALGIFGAFGVFGALATRLAALLPALACVACRKLRGIVHESPCILKA